MGACLRFWQHPDQADRGGWCELCFGHDVTPCYPVKISVARSRREGSGFSICAKAVAPSQEFQPSPSLADSSFLGKIGSSLRQPLDVEKRSASAAAREGSTCGIQATGFDMIIVMLRQHWRRRAMRRGAESRQSGGRARGEWGNRPSIGPAEALYSGGFLERFRCSDHLLRSPC